MMMFNYSAAILIIDHRLQYKINPPCIFQSFIIIQSRADKIQDIFRAVRLRKQRIILLRLTLQPL